MIAAQAGKMNLCVITGPKGLIQKNGYRRETESEKYLRHSVTDRTGLGVKARLGQLGRFRGLVSIRGAHLAG